MSCRAGRIASPSGPAAKPKSRAGGTERLEAVYLRKETVRAVWRQVRADGGESVSELVEDLLLLARLDAGRPLAQDPVDLTMVVMETVSDARAAGPDHRWALELPDEPAEVVGDATADRLVDGSALGLRG